MYCYKCGNKLDENAKFCNMCGARQTVSPKIEIIKNNTDKTNIKSGTTAKKKTSIIFVILAIVTAIVLICIFVLDELSGKQKIIEKEDAIQEVKNAHFEFLDEITVGALLYKYYGEDNWTCFADDVVQFWGTNKKDNSGLALHFSDVAPDNTVKVTYIKYHNEDETAHDISNEEFETYILSLYEQLNSKNENTDVTTHTETVISTTQPATTHTETATSTTTIAEQYDQTEKSEHYLIYLTLLKTLDKLTKKEYSSTTDPLYYSYYLYDINKDGFYELIIHLGEFYGDATILIGTIDEKSEDIYVEVGELDGGHISLIEKDGRLYTYYLQNGYHIIEEIKMIGGDGIWSVVQENVLEKSGIYERLDYGTAIKGYNISDTSAIESLCPQDLLDDAYINSCVEDLINEAYDDVLLSTGIVVTKTDPLNVRKSPSINSEIIGKIAKGSTVEIYSETNGWCEIRYNGQVGYVSKDFIEYN